MSTFATHTRDEDRHPQTRPPRVAIIGAGDNFGKRLLPALVEVEGRLDIRVFDIRPVSGVPFPCTVVSDEPDTLARVLHAENFDAAIIEAPAVTHPTLIRAALKSGIQRVVCEKPIALTATEGEQVVRLCQMAEPRQKVRFMDHYLGLSLVQRLLRIVQSGKLGPTSALRLELKLHEDKGLTEKEIAEHRPGMGAFLHHTVAFLCMVFPEVTLVPVEARVAHHWAAPSDVADTYRAAVFQDANTHGVLAHVSAGKYFSVAKRQFEVRGPFGSAVLDRVTEQLTVNLRGTPPIVIAGAAGDLGYRSTIAALADRRLPRWLLTPQNALRISRLLDEAHSKAYPVNVYEDLIVDWQVLTV